MPAPVKPILPAYAPPMHALDGVNCKRHLILTEAPVCLRDADGWLEGTPLCADCAMVVVERWAIYEQDPWAVLPAIDDTFFVGGMS